MEIIDLVERRQNDVKILGYARRVFPDVEGIIPVPNLPSMLVSREGGLIAFGWLDEQGQARFKIAVSWEEMN